MLLAPLHVRAVVVMGIHVGGRAALVFIGCSFPGSWYPTLHVFLLRVVAEISVICEVPAKFSLFVFVECVCVSRNDHSISPRLCSLPL